MEVNKSIRNKLFSIFQKNPMHGIVSDKCRKTRQKTFRMENPWFANIIVTDFVDLLKVYVSFETIFTYNESHHFSEITGRVFCVKRKSVLLHLCSLRACLYWKLTHVFNFSCGIASGKISNFVWFVRFIALLSYLHTLRWSRRVFLLIFLNTP